MAAQATHAAFAGNEPDGRWASGPSVQSANTCSTWAMVLLGLEGRERGVGEHGVITPDGKQLVLAFGGGAVAVFDPADDQPGGDGLPLLRDEGGVFRLGHLRLRHPGPQLIIPDRAGVADRGPGAVGDGGDRRL